MTKCEDTLPAEANTAAGAEAKNRFSRTENVLIQQLYNQGTWKNPRPAQPWLYMKMMQQQALCLPKQMKSANTLGSSMLQISDTLNIFFYFS